MAEDEHNQRAKVGSDNVEDDKKNDSNFETIKKLDKKWEEYCLEYFTFHSKYHELDLLTTTVTIWLFIPIGNVLS